MELAKISCKLAVNYQILYLNLCRHVINFIVVKIAVLVVLFFIPCYDTVYITVHILELVYAKKNSKLYKDEN